MQCIVTCATGTYS